jgi:high-affinity iron transporter
MLASFLLTIREGLEAALVIGMALALLNRLKRSDSNYLVWRGAALGVVLSAAAALALALFGMEFEGIGEMIFEGSAMLLAAGVLTWLILWAHRSAGSPKNEIEIKTRQALGQKSGGGLFTLAFLAVFREGIEIGRAHV